MAYVDRVAPVSSVKKFSALLQLQGRALLFAGGFTAVLVLVGVGGLLLSRPSGLKTGESYAAGSYTPGVLAMASSPVTPEKLGKADRLTVNGQLTVSGGLVLNPGSAPLSAVQGELYYDKAINKPFYFDGKEFVALSGASQTGVDSLGGLSGAVGIGNGLQIGGGQLRLSDTVLRSLAQASVTTTAGATPAVNSLNSLNGVVALQGAANQILVTTNASTGLITVTTAQDINTTSAPSSQGSPR